MHKFSLLRENSLVLDQSKSYYSDKDPHYSIISSDYYVFAFETYPYLVFSLFLRINLLFVLCMNCVIFVLKKSQGL